METGAAPGCAGGRRDRHLVCRRSARDSLSHASAWRVATLVLFIATIALGLASCSDDEGTRPPSPSATGEQVAIDSRPWQTEFRGDIAVTLASQRVHQCDEFRYRQESSQPLSFLVQCLETGDQFHVVPSSGEVTNMWKPGMPPPRPLRPPSRLNPSRSTARELQADPDDMRQARNFVAGLPPACSRSSISVASDQTVIIHVTCSDGTKSAQSQVRIKNGVLTQLR